MSSAHNLPRNSHKMFLQSIMSRFVLNEEEVYGLLKASYDKYEGRFNVCTKQQI